MASTTSNAGYKTTEFWLSTLVVILGILMSSGVVADGGMVAKIVGGVLGLLGALGYTAKRLSLKTETQKTETAKILAAGPANDNGEVVPLPKAS
jgi:hypothetical protein